MKITSVELEKVAVHQEQYPSSHLPEIALAGRSNVGKSSFINSFVNRKSLARTSGTPGKTRTINFYKVNNGFRLVDLPGYGYARVSKKEKEKWGHIIEEYLNTRDNLKEIILIVDIRHSPTDQDLQMYDWIKAFGFKGIVIATKADKVSKGKFQHHQKIIRKKLGISDSNLIIPYSSTNKVNKENIDRLVEDILK